MTKIEYNGSIVATVEGGNTATLPIKDKKMKSDIKITVPEAESGADSPLPTEVSTEAEMTALLTSGEVGGVYKYTGTTGTYENGALYVLENNLITFTIGGTTYQAEEGMTWAEWVASDYRTHYYWIIDGGAVIYGASSSSITYVTKSDGTTTVNSTEVIESGYNYRLYITGGGGGSN